MSTTVASVVEVLGQILVVGSSGDMSRLVTEVVVTDPAFPSPIRPGALVVAVGYRSDDDGMRDLVDRADNSGACAIVTKGPAPQGELPLPLIVIDAAADWGQVCAVIRSAMSPLAGIEAESLFELADAISGLCGGAVVIHDAGWQLLSYSGVQSLDEVRSETILGRRAPLATLQALRNAGVIDRLERGEIVHVNEVPDMSPRYAAPVLAAGQLIGTIWMLPDADCDPQQATADLRRSAEIAALTLLRHAHTNAIAGHSRDPALEALLNGARTDLLVAQQLGVSPESGFVLAGLRPTTNDLAERAAVARRLLGLVRSHSDAYRVNALSTSVDDTVYVLFPRSDPASRAQAVKVVTDIHTRLQVSAPHRAMISSGFQALTETNAIRAVVDELLDLSERRNWAGLTDSDAVQASWRLEQFREVALAHPALLQGPVMRLVEHDKDHDGELVQTLRAWFESVGDTRLTAEKLSLHVNTVRYRLRRVEEIGGLSLDDPDERLLVELQIRLLAP